MSVCCVSKSKVKVNLYSASVLRCICVYIYIYIYIYIFYHIIAHSYLLSGTDQPECSACHCPLTVKHILVECPALISTRNKHFTASSMKDLFDNVATRNIINFIKESHFYSTI